MCECNSEILLEDTQRLHTMKLNELSFLKDPRESVDNNRFPLTV